MLNNDKWTKELSFLANIISKYPFEKKIKWGADVYTYKGQNVISYGGFKNYFALWFFNGVFLKDADNLLVNAQEGKTKSLRQWRFNTIAEIDEVKLNEYILEAIDNEEKGLKIKPEKIVDLPLPELLIIKFKELNLLKEKFYKITPGRQKEYILFINEAKQEKTKLKRLEKIIPMIMQGIGLNDQYK